MHDGVVEINHQWPFFKKKKYLKIDKLTKLLKQTCIANCCAMLKLQEFILVIKLIINIYWLLNNKHIFLYI